MPRNINGLYTLPAGNPVVPGTLIETTWANPTMADLANEITQSLPRNGSAAMTGPLILSRDGILPKEATTVDQLTAYVSGNNSFLPAGAIQAFAMNTVPTGWLECNGVAVSRVTYANLFSVIGVTYGAGNGVTTFNLPDLRGEFIRGLDNGRSVDPGRTLGSNQTGANNPHTHTIVDPSHNHTQNAHVHGITDPGHNHSANTYDVFDSSPPGKFGSQAPTTGAITDYTNSNTTGVTVNAAAGTNNAASTGISINSEGTESRPRNVAMVYCIKAFGALQTDGLGTMAFQNKETVAITGGSGVFTTLQCTTAPTNPNDVARLADVGGSVAEVLSADPAMILVDNTTPSTPILRPQANVPNGIVKLDANGKVPNALIDPTGYNYQGTWDASGGTLPGGTQLDGSMYYIDVAGTLNLYHSNGVQSATSCPIGTRIVYVTDSPTLPVPGWYYEPSPALAGATASQIIFTPTGAIGATDVQAAVAELVSDLAADSGASLVGYLPAGVGAVAMNAQEKLRESVSVKDFGAVGDGVTDDTAAVISAISTGNRVYFPVGTYVVSNSSMPSAIRMWGDGVGQSIILWKATSTESSLFSLSGLVSVEAEGLTFDSNRTNQTDSAGYYGVFGGTIANGSIIAFRRCEFKAGRISDIYLAGPTGAGEYAEVEIDGCRFYDGLVGTVTRAAQAVSLSEGIRLCATGNTFKQPVVPVSYGRGGIVMQRPAGSTSLSWGQFEASGNTFENFGRQTADRLGCLYVYSGSELATITSNKFRNSVGTAITVKSDCGSTTITGNVINGHIDAAVAAICCFDQADTYASSIGRDLIVANNSIYGAEYQSIYVDGGRNALADFSNVLISGNVCDGGLRGVHFRNVDTPKVTGNIVRNTTGVAIFSEDCSGDVDITGNTISGSVVGVDVNGATSTARIEVARNGISTMTGTAIRLRSPVESFSVTGNRIAGCTSAFDTRGATQFSVIARNTVRGETTVWDKSGAYSGLQYEQNITSIAAPFTSTRQLTIAADVVTVHADWHYIETEGAAPTDDLSTINGGYEGRRLVLFAANNARDVVLKDGVGNLRLAGDFTLSHADDTIELLSRGNVWYELGRSDNTA